MKYPKVSVIVPVYKVEKYLGKCLESLGRQNYENLEIVLVDDGSPDSCGIMCEQFAGKHPNVLVIHQENQGLSAARNNGVAASHGEYITFVDSDDYVADDYVQYLVDLLLDHHGDISVGHYVPVYHLKDPRLKKKKEFQKVFRAEEALAESFYSVKFGVAAWAKLYRRDLVEKYPYPVGKLYEELATTYKMIGESKAVVYGNRDIYFYVQRAGSIMTRKIGERELYGLTAAGELLNYTKTFFPGAVHAAKVRYEIKIQQYMPAVFANKENHFLFRFLRSESKKYFWETVFDRKAGLNFTIKLIAIMLGTIPSKIVFGAVNRKKFGSNG